MQTSICMKGDVTNNDIRIHLHTVTLSGIRFRCKLDSDTDYESDYEDGAHLLASLDSDS